MARKPARDSAKPTPKLRPKAARPSAMVRAEHGVAPVHLTTPERRVFNEALRLGADLADEMESKVMAYGRWLLETVFANDAAKALDDRTQNPVWLELVRRSGGPTLRIGRRMLYVALKLAAYDKRISDQTWRGLDAGRKELLLPLNEDQRLRSAAQHVAKFNLTQTKTTAYVRALLTESGAPPTRLRISAPMLSGRMKKVSESFGGAAILKRARALHNELDGPERQALVSEIEKARDVLTALAKEVRGR